jgi:hypothetical protein
LGVSPKTDLRTTEANADEIEAIRIFGFYLVYANSAYPQFFLAPKALRGSLALFADTPILPPS